MKFVAKVSATIALMILLIGSVQAADLQIDSEKIFVEQSNIVPRRHRPFVPPINVPHRTSPRKDYSPRKPELPAPRYIPSRPRPTYDNRGGKRKIFAPPQATHR